jgi:hypothetical protein
MRAGRIAATKGIAMFRSLVAAAGLVLAAPASAGIVFSDTFDGENGGASALNYAAFANFSVSSTVDLIASGAFGINCVGGSGACVDLDGSGGLGTLTSKVTYTVAAGDTVRLFADISGNQRNGDLEGYSLTFNFNNFEDLFDVGYNLGSGDVVVSPTFFGTQPGVLDVVGGGDPFATRSIFFTAGSAASFTFSIGTDSIDAVGPILDNVRLDITRANVAAVPEPATWAMMIMGFGLVGASLRRRTVSVRFA